MVTSDREMELLRMDRWGASGMLAVFLDKDGNMRVCFIIHSVFNPHLRTFFSWLLEREGERKEGRERERNINGREKH